MLVSIFTIRSNKSRTKIEQNNYSLDYNYIGVDDPKIYFYGIPDISYSIDIAINPLSTYSGLTNFSGYTQDLLQSYLSSEVAFTGVLNSDISEAYNSGLNLIGFKLDDLNSYIGEFYVS